MSQSTNYYTRLFYNDKPELTMYCQYQKHKKMHKVSSPDLVVHYDYNKYSSLHKGGNCTAMVLQNLADPYWISVPCNESLVQAIYCGIDTNQEFRTSTIKNQSIFLADPSICNKNSLLVNNLCVNLKVCNIPRAKKSSFQIGHFDVQDIETIFDGVSEPFPPLISENLTHILTFTRCSETFRITYKHIPGDLIFGFLVQTSHRKELSSSGNVYMCKEHEYISTMFLCDTSNDCTRSADDESECACSDGQYYSSKCKHLISESGNKTCSVFYTPTKSNDCVLYLFSETKSFEPQNYGFQTRKFMLDDNLLHDRLVRSNSIPVEMQECEHKTSFSMKCWENGQLYCGYPGCYNVGDICVFNISIFGKLRPCTNGGHIQNCINFTCNMMYKCPSFYCIPWGYMCDGKWDCPGGLEEMLMQGCGQIRICTNLFKCHHSQVCVHMGDLCNGFKDCIFGDDEYFCSLQNSNCPSSCECLLYSFKCHNLTVSPQSHLLCNTCWLKATYFSPNISSIIFNDAIILSSVDSNLVHLCQLISSIRGLIKLVASAGKISALATGCFQSSFKLKIIDVSSNQIAIIHRETFASLSNLLALNLTKNFLSGLARNMFAALNKIQMLSIKYNGLSIFGRNLFEEMKVAILQTDNCHLCCLLPVGASCTAECPWYISCSNLLPTTTVQVTFYAVSCCILIFNAVLIALQQVSFVKGTDKSRAYGVTVAAINAADLLCALPLFVLWSSDLHYSGDFVVKEARWRSSALCFSVFGIMLQFSFSSPFILGFSSFSRLMVVVYPFGTCYKETHFVINNILTLFALGILLSCSLTITFFFHEKMVPMALCSPFVDPAHTSKIIEVITWIMVCTHIVSSTFIILVYIFLLKYVWVSQKNVELLVSVKRSNVALIIQIVIVTSSNIFCWIPSSIIYVLSMFMKEYPIDMIIWITIAVTPINSIINPLVYISTTLRKILCT